MRKTLVSVLYISLLFSICGCSNAISKIEKPSDYQTGLEETVYLNEQSKMFNKYSGFKIELHKDFTSTISYRTSNNKKHTYQTDYSYDFRNAFDPNNHVENYLENYVLLKFESYLSDDEHSDTQYSKAIDLANGFFGIDFKENVCTYYNWPNRVAYFTKNKHYHNNLFSIEKKFVLKEQNLYKKESKFEYIDIEFKNNQKCKIVFKIENKKEEERTIEYEFVDYCPAVGNRKTIFFIDDIETELILITGTFYFENENQLRYAYIPYNQGVPEDSENYSPANYKSELLFEEMQ